MSGPEGVVENAGSGPDHIDRKLALSFGAVVLVLILTVAAVASLLFGRLQKKEEDRLAGVIASILAESISRISFSGKHHARLLSQELKLRIPELAYISVETPDGRVIAHSDEAQNDAVVSEADAATSRQSLRQDAPVVVERHRRQAAVKEIVVPYHGGYGGQSVGVVRVGVGVDDARGDQRNILLTLASLVGVLTAAAILVVSFLSRRFGGAVRTLAWQLRGVLDRAPLAIVISDRTGRIVVSGSVFEHWFGATQGACFMSQVLSRGLSSDAVALLEAMDDRVFSRGEKAEVEMALEFDRKARIWHVSKFPIAKDAKGSVSLICTFLSDITERKQAEDGLRESEETFRTLFERSRNPILLLRGERFVECNQAALDALGTSDKSRFILSTPMDISPEVQPDGRLSSEAVAVYNATAHREGFCRFEWMCRRYDGTPFLLEVSLMPIMVKGERLLHVAWYDITARKRVESELHNLNKRLEELVAERTLDLTAKAAELERANSKLLELDEMKSSFVSLVSHELRTPLTSVLGFSKLIRKDFEKHFLPLAGDQERTLKKGRQLLDNIHIIQEEGERLTRLINDFLDLTKIESGSVAWADKPVAPRDIIDKATQAVAGQLAGKPQVAIAVRASETLPAVQVDIDRMLQLFINLLSNAIKFTDAGLITIAVAQPSPDVVRFAVSDTGCGIPDQELPEIFNKFHQAACNAAREKPPGTGLGLAICKQIVGHYGGRIWAESVVGQGSTFFVELPLG